MENQEIINTITVISRLWPIFVSLVVGAGVALIWFIRLENKVNNGAKEFEAHQRETSKKFEKQEDAMKENNLALWNKIQVVESKFDKLFESIGEIKGLINHKGKD